jgi:HK97 gp10 family phage protein
LATSTPVVELKWNGDELLKQIREGTPDALFAGAEMLVEKAAENAPRNTGILADSGYAATSEKSTYKADKRHNKEIKVKEGQAIAAFAAFYARFVEFGTKHKGARPFLRRALDEVKGKIGEEVVTKMGRKFK